MSVAKAYYLSGIKLGDYFYTGISIVILESYFGLNFVSGIIF